MCAYAKHYTITPNTSVIHKRPSRSIWLRLARPTQFWDSNRHHRTHTLCCCSRRRSCRLPCNRARRILGQLGPGCLGRYTRTANIKVTSVAPKMHGQVWGNSPSPTFWQYFLLTSPLSTVLGQQSPPSYAQPSLLFSSSQLPSPL